MFLLTSHPFAWHSLDSLALSSHHFSDVSSITASVLQRAHSYTPTFSKSVVGNRYGLFCFSLYRLILSFSLCLCS